LNEQIFASADTQLAGDYYERGSPAARVKPDCGIFLAQPASMVVSKALRIVPFFPA
jgi:hypothetical protein